MVHFKVQRGVTPLAPAHSHDPSHNILPANESGYLRNGTSMVGDSGWALHAQYSSTSSTRGALCRVEGSEEGWCDFLASRSWDYHILPHLSRAHRIPDCDRVTVPYWGYVPL